MEIISTIIIGAIAGWLGSTIFRGSSLGLFGNIVVGIIGSFVRWMVFGKTRNQSWFWLDGSSIDWCCWGTYNFVSLKSDFQKENLKTTTFSFKAL